MARSRFVQPDTVRLSLSDGDWVEVKKELNAGEQRRIFAGVVKTMHAGEKLELNPEQIGKSKLLEYIVAWSFIGLSGKPEPFSAAALDNLDADTYRELIELVDAHEEAAEKAMAERKNGQGGETTSSVTSPSAA
jgi:hypothetical protein